MEVKTESGGTFDAAGNGTKGIAIAGLVTGALGTVMSGLLGGNSMINGNCNGWGNAGAWGRNAGNYGYGYGAFNPLLVTEPEYRQGRENNALFADLCKEKSERYTDKAVIAQAEKEAARDAKLAKDLLDIGVGVTRIDQQVIADREKNLLREQIINLKMNNLEEKIKNAEDKLAGAMAFEAERRRDGDEKVACSVGFEAERRKNGDENLFNYMRGTYVPGKLVMPKDNICPEVMPRYTAWVAPVDNAAVTPTV